MNEIVSTLSAPSALGPYSQGVKAGHMVFTSGQIGMDPSTGQVVSGGVQAETHQVLKNLREVLAAAGATMSDVVKTTVFLRDMGDFAEMNEVYAQYFAQGAGPARSTVQVASLPRGVAVEIEAIAIA